MERRDSPEYVEIHRQLFEGLAAQAEESVDMHPRPLILYKRGDEPMLRIVAGGFSPEQLQDQAPREGEAADPHRRAQERDAILEGDRTETLLPMTVWLAAAQAKAEGGPSPYNPYDAEGNLIQLSYEHVVWREGFFKGRGQEQEDVGIVTIVELYGADSMAPAAIYYKIRWYGGDLDDSIALVRWGSKLMDVASATNPLEDELEEQCIKLFGRGSAVESVLMGKVITKEAVDRILEAVAVSVEGILPDEATAELLARVRVRAFARIEEDEIAGETIMHVPAPEKVVEFTNRLRRVT